MASVHGTCTEPFQPLKTLFDTNITNNTELGAAIYVNLNGQTVVDLWGGFADSQRTKPWTENTIVNVWSASKNVTALAALILVERGLLDLDAPVAKYWPEFAAKGKEGILVRHVLSHTSGISGWEQPLKYEDIYDLETSTARLADQAAWWSPPGSAAGYHAVTYGHLVGEIVRRVTGKTLREFVHDEIASPLDADYQVGAREEDWHRVAEIVPPPPTIIDPEVIKAMGPDSLMIKSLGFAFDSAYRPNTPEFKRAQIGSVNGHTNAKALGKIFSPLVLDDDDGDDKDGKKKRLLSRQTINKIFETQFEGQDLVTLMPVKWGVGYGLSHPNGVTPYVPQGRVFFWTGWGGSILLIDFEKKLTIAYVMNNMGEGVMGSERTKQYVEAIYEVVRGLEQK